MVKSFLLLCLSPLLFAGHQLSPPPLSLGLAPQPKEWSLREAPSLLLVSGTVLPLRISREGRVLSHHLLQPGRQQIPLPAWVAPSLSDPGPSPTLFSLEVLFEGSVWQAPLHLFTQVSPKDGQTPVFHSNSPLHCTLKVFSDSRLLGEARVSFDLPVSGQEAGEPRGFQGGAWDPAKGRRPQDCQFSLLAIPVVLGKCLWGKKMEQQERARQTVWDQADHLLVWQGPCVLANGQEGQGELTLHPFPFSPTRNNPRDVPQEVAFDTPSSKGP